MFDNLGTHHHPVPTTSPMAQRHFDQGRCLYHAFNSVEALRSLQQAARLDPSSAMAYWGIALALGPTINMPLTRQGDVVAYRAIRLAKSVSSAARRDRMEEAIHHLKEAVRYDEPPAWYFPCAKPWGQFFWWPAARRMQSRFTGTILGSIPAMAGLCLD